MDIGGLNDQNKPSILVVIPALNEEPLIRECLESISDLNYPKEAVLVTVVDNGSKDRTREIAASFGARVLEVPKHTIARSRNAGAGCADSEIIAFVDADCLVDPNWLCSAVHRLSEMDVVGVGGYPRVLTSRANRLQRTWAALAGGEAQDVKEVSWLPSANLVVKRHAFNLIGGFNDDLVTCEDSDLGYRLARTGRLLADPSVKVFHLREPATFREFFRKEMWHARGNLEGLMSHRIHISELPSLVSPIAVAVGSGLLVAGLVLDLQTMILGTMAMTIPVALYAARGCSRSPGLAYNLGVYAVYFGARGCAVWLTLLRAIGQLFGGLRRRLVGF